MSVEGEFQFKKWLGIMADSYYGALDFASPDESEKDVYCELCDQYFIKFQIGGHRNRAHGIKNPLRRKIYGSLCYACRQDCRTRQKLIKHVSYSPNQKFQCKQFWLDNFLDLDPDTYAILEQETAESIKAIEKKGGTWLSSDIPADEWVGPLPPFGKDWPYVHPSLMIPQ